MIRLYGASWCSPCKVVKAFLQENNIEYNYYDIDEEEGKEALRLRGIRSVPVIIKDEGDEEKIYVGSNLRWIKEFLGV